MKKKEIRTVRDYIAQFKETVIDSDYKRHSTKVVWVDNLPPEEQWEDDSLEKGYRGRRNMTYINNVEHINPWIAIRRESYNSGPGGICHYTSIVYLKRTIWKEFHLNPFETLGIRVCPIKSYIVRQGKGLWCTQQKFSSLDEAKKAQMVLVNSIIIGEHRF